MKWPVWTEVPGFQNKIREDNSLRCYCDLPFSAVRCFCVVLTVSQRFNWSILDYIPDQCSLLASTEIFYHLSFKFSHILSQSSPFSPALFKICLILFSAVLLTFHFESNFQRFYHLCIIETILPPGEWMVWDLQLGKSTSLAKIFLLVFFAEPFFLDQRNGNLDLEMGTFHGISRLALRGLQKMSSCTCRGMAWGRRRRNWKESLSI